MNTSAHCEACTVDSDTDTMKDNLSGDISMKFSDTSQTESTDSTEACTKCSIDLRSENGENRLSKVLESLPLVYLPHTKQLVTHTDAKLTDTKPKTSLRLTPSPLLDQCLLLQPADTDDRKSLASTEAEVDLDTVDLLGHARSAITFQKGPDCSSLTSLSSISTDYSLSALGDDVTDLRLTSPDFDEDSGGGFGLVDVNLHARNTFDKSSTLSSLDSGIDDPGAAKHKRRGLTHLARTLFSKKSKDKLSIPTVSAPGWRLFGRLPAEVPRVPDPSPEPSIHSSVGNLSSCSIRSSSPSESRKKDIEVSSTTGLVLEDRPECLPPKPENEAAQHQQEYDSMMEAAKKRELKEMKKKKQVQQKQLVKEDKISAAVKLWKTEILPHWSSVHSTKRIRELWWAGIPPSVRGAVWKLAIGNKLNITSEMCSSYLKSAKESLELLDASQTPSSIARCSADDDISTSPPLDPCPDKSDLPSSPAESSVELIRLDVSRTFPQLCIFQKGGPYYDLLLSLLGAYTCYRPDVGYVQGMSFLAAILLLNMDVEDAFTCFANLLNQPCMVAFFRINENLMKSYFLAYEEFFHLNLPKLYSHFRRHNVTPDLYLIDWVYSLFSRSLPLDVASRVWDVFCRDGETFLFRTALGILKLYEELLLSLDFIHLAQFLTRLPDTVSADLLFKAVDSIRMSCDRGHFLQEFEAFKASLDRS